MRQVDATDAWNPTQYAKFAAERSRPFFDLLDLVQPVPGGRVVDLGCGPGELTARLHAHTGAATTVGIDNSPAMLAEAAAHASGGLSFESGDIGGFGDGDDARFDIVFSNAALQWVGDHETVLRRWASALGPGGQVAVQVPANADHPSHTLAADVAMEPPFREALGGAPPADVVLGVLKPERYAEVLDEIGFVEQHVRLQVYGHHLASTADVVEWTKGTTLVRFRRLLSPELFDAFLERYATRVLEALGERAPYFYAFKRILFWARRR